MEPSINQFTKSAKKKKLITEIFLLIFRMVAMSLDERRDNQEFSRSLSADFAKSTQVLSDEKADLMILNFRRRYQFPFGSF